MDASQNQIISDKRPDLASKRHSPADWLTLSTDRVVSVEHPAIIQNIDRGLRSLGGEHHLKHLLASTDHILSVGLSLRPEDPLAKKLVSKEVPVQNVLLRVTVPKRTGRKRKRGSTDPFEYHGEQEARSDIDHGSNLGPLSAEQLLRRLRDNPDAYTIQPIAPVKQTHRFRALPDFQLKARTQPAMREIAEKLKKPTLSSIKDFNLDMTPGISHEDVVIAPPNFTSVGQSMNYLYRQNPGVSHLTDEHGRIKTINTQAPRKRAVVSFPSNIKLAPTGPPPQLQQIAKLPDALKQCIRNVEKLLETRPLVTRRVAANLVDWGNESIFKEATQYVGYSFKSGPWRDTLVKYGVDPRKDPKYRFYQTFSFQLFTKDKAIAEAKKMRDGKDQWIRGDRHRKDDRNTHVFDGKGVTTNGKLWQVCDIQEPLLKKMLDTENLQSECDAETWGWYHHGTISKVRVIMRDMIGSMLKGETPDMTAYEVLSSMPDEMDPKTWAGCYFDREIHGEKVMALSMEIRNLAKTDIAQRVRDKFGAKKTGTGGKKGVEAEAEAEEEEDDEEEMEGDGDGDGDGDVDGDGDGDGEGDEDPGASDEEMEG